MPDHDWKAVRHIVFGIVNDYWGFAGSMIVEEMALAALERLVKVQHKYTTFFERPGWFLPEVHAIIKRAAIDEYRVFEKRQRHRPDRPSFFNIPYQDVYESALRAVCEERPRPDEILHHRQVLLRLVNHPGLTRLERAILWGLMVGKTLTDVAREEGCSASYLSRRRETLIEKLLAVRKDECRVIRPAAAGPRRRQTTTSPTLTLARNGRASG